MSQIDWKKVECAIIEWAQSKLPELMGPNIEKDRFVWADQNLPRPPYPFILFKRDSVVRTSAVDEVRTSTDLTQPQGEEIGLETVGVREFTLSISAFVDEETGSTDPNCDAMALVTRLQLSLGQLSTREIFCLAGLAVVEELAVVDLSAVANGKFISRAAMDVRLRTTFSCVERTGYIETVRIRSVPCNPSGPCDVTGVDIEVTGN